MILSKGCVIVAKDDHDSPPNKLIYRRYYKKQNTDSNLPCIYLYIYNKYLVRQVFHGGVYNASLSGEARLIGSDMSGPRYS